MDRESRILGRRSSKYGGTYQGFRRPHSGVNEPHGNGSETLHNEETCLFTARIIANHPALRKSIYLNKVDTYAKAHADDKGDEQATVHSKMVATSPLIRKVKSPLVRQPKHTVVGTAASQGVWLWLW